MTELSTARYYFKDGKPEEVSKNAGLYQTELSTVLITGGAGSLGRGFVQLLSKTHAVTVVDSNEWAVAELRSLFPEVRVILGDFVTVGGYFDYIIHAAAYKHVNLGEEQVPAFIDTNLSKTVSFYGQVTTPNLLYISTDKAVEPISTYGATKMIAERLTWSSGGKVARLGNILNSSGSVIPIWEQAIAAGDPIPITDTRMVRYFIEVDDAASYIWKQFTGSSNLIVPPMQQVPLTELLDKVLLKHGFSSLAAYGPGTKTIGLRPGEKLEEKLFWPGEEKTW